jgi:Ca2+-binding RTX toxin-like protein
MATLTVGAGQQFSTIAAAVAASHDGDVVQVQAGTYVNDFAEIKTKITLEGVGGMVHMVATGPIPNGKGILVTDTDVTIDHFEFSGATVADGNGAGVRYQGGALTLTNDYFHDNQDGLLANPSTTGTITIRNSEFAHNGAGDGYTHNLYVGDIAKLTIADSYFHDAVVGHEIKSRAEVTEITNTRIFDNSGSASYSIDLPNGGQATLSGNTIEQGPNSQNPNIVAYGEEGGVHANSSLTMSNNTVLNDLGKGALLWDASGTAATVDGTKVWGVADGQMVSGSGASVTNTTHLASEPALDTSHPWSAGGPSQTSGVTVSGSDPTVYTGTPNADTITGADGQYNAIHGAEGDDSITGGSGFNAVNGNQGQDTVIGRSTVGDWLLGGQGNDSIDASASPGDNIINGNLGNDTLFGGSGADSLRGGQGDDVIHAGSGKAWISGDLGANTIYGGQGANTFHTGAGHDIVNNWHSGDLVQVDHGVTYTATQVSGDVHVNLSNGGEMDLIGAQLSALPPGWIVTT